MSELGTYFLATCNLIVSNTFAVLCAQELDNNEGEMVAGQLDARMAYEEGQLRSVEGRNRADIDKEAQRRGLKKDLAATSGSSPSPLLAKPSVPAPGGSIPRTDTVPSQPAPAPVRPAPAPAGTGQPLPGPIVTQPATQPAMPSTLRPAPPQLPALGATGQVGGVVCARGRAFAQHDIPSPADPQDKGKKDNKGGYEPGGKKAAKPIPAPQRAETLRECEKLWQSFLDISRADQINDVVSSLETMNKAHGEKTKKS